LSVFYRPPGEEVLNEISRVVHLLFGLFHYHRRHRPRPRHRHCPCRPRARPKRDSNVKFGLRRSRREERARLTGPCWLPFELLDNPRRRNHLRLLSFRF